MQKFLELFSDALEKEKDSITMQDHFREYPEWDSLAVLSILAMIHDEYNVEIPRVEFQKLIAVQDLFEFVTKGKS